MVTGLGGAIPVPSPSRNSLKDVPIPALLWLCCTLCGAHCAFPCRHSSQFALPCPGQQGAGAGDAVTPELLVLVSLLPLTQPQPSAQSRMEGEQLLPLHGWARTGDDAKGEGKDR